LEQFKSGLPLTATQITTQKFVRLFNTTTTNTAQQRSTISSVVVAQKTSWGLIPARIQWALTDAHRQNNTPAENPGV
jgi:hypothetical protein